MVIWFDAAKVLYSTAESKRYRDTLIDTGLELTQNKDDLPIQTIPIIRYNIRYKGNDLDILRTMQGFEVVLLYIIGK